MWLNPQIKEHKIWIELFQISVSNKWIREAGQIFKRPCEVHDSSTPEAIYDEKIVIWCIKFYLFNSLMETTNIWQNHFVINQQSDKKKQIYIENMTEKNEMTLQSILKHTKQDIYMSLMIPSARPLVLPVVIIIFRQSLKKSGDWRT